MENIYKIKRYNRIEQAFSKWNCNNTNVDNVSEMIFTSIERQIVKVYREYDPIWNSSRERKESIEISVSGISTKKPELILERGDRYNYPKQKIKLPMKRTTPKTFDLDIGVYSSKLSERRNGHAHLDLRKGKMVLTLVWFDERHVIEETTFRSVQNIKKQLKSKGYITNPLSYSN